VTTEQDEGLAEAFWAVARTLRHRTRDALQPFDVTPSLSRALGVLARDQPIRLSTLAEHLRIAARSATELVDDLQERGLVQRRPDPGDRRAVLVALTADGETAAGSIRTVRQAEAQRFFAALSEEDRTTLTRILRTLAG